LRPDKEVDLNVSFGEVGSIERERMINGLGVSEDVLMFTLMERSFFWSLKELTDRKDVRHLLSFATSCIGTIGGGQFPIFIFFNSHKFISIQCSLLILMLSHGYPPIVIMDKAYKYNKRN
jgi:hypothetical protein